MKKKVSTKKITEKPKKKEIKKKPKTTLKPAKKTITMKKIKVKSKEKPKKVAKKVLTKIEEKAKKKAKEVETKKAIKIPEKKVPAKVEVEKKEVYHAIKEKIPPTPWETLPQEYGENSITLITVDPNKLFTFWEVREDILTIFTGNLNIRVYDVTGIDFDGMNANSYFDIAANERIGSCYIDVSPAKEIIADIGIIYFEGIFITVARSNKASTPPIPVSEEGMLPQKLYDTSLRIGY